MAQLLLQVSLPLLLAFVLGWLAKSLVTSKAIERLRAALSEAQADAMNREAEVLTLSSRIQNSEAVAHDDTRLRATLAGKDHEIASLREQLRSALEERSNAVTAAAARVEELDRMHTEALTAREVESSRLRRELETQKLEVSRLSTFVQTLEPLSMQLSEAERALTAAVEAKNSEITRLTRQVAHLEAALSSAPDGLAAVAWRGAEANPVTDAVDELESRPAEPARVQTELANAVNGSRVEFDDATAEIRPESRPVLDSIVSVLRRYPEVPVEISAHTEEGPDFWYNFDLSRRRATAVKEYLVARGVPPATLNEMGCGQTRPVGDNHTPEGRRANRRVEFRVATEILSARGIARAASAAG